MILRSKSSRQRGEQEVRWRDTDVGAQFSGLPMQTFTLAQAAGFLKMHPEEVRHRAKKGLIPASKPGRRWVFIDDDLAAFLRQHYPTHRQALRVTFEKGSAPWASVNEATSGGSTSQHHQASEYEEVLKRATRQKRPNTTTS